MFIILLAFNNGLRAQAWNAMPPFSVIQSFSLKKDIPGTLEVPAALAGVKTFSVAAFGQQNYLLSSVRSVSLAAAIPAGRSHFGLLASYFGFSLHNETLLALAYARSMGTADIGIRFNVYRVATAGYGNIREVNAEAGACLHFSPDLTAGLHVANPFHFSTATELPSLPFTISAGLGWDASDNFYVGGMILKKAGMPTDLAAGIQYGFVKNLFARAGVSTAIPVFYFGLGYIFGDLKVDLISTLHPQLGISPGLMLSYFSGGTK